MEPTDGNLSFQHKITIEAVGDDQDFNGMIELMRSAFLAWGFHPKTVSDWFDPEGGE